MMQNIVVTMRQASLADIDRIVAIHADAFHRTFVAAFGNKRYQTGLRVMADVWRRQGVTGLQGMWVAEVDHYVVGTITMRSRGGHWMPPSTPVEWLFIQSLGIVRGLYALNALSFIEHHITTNELYITDVAVDSHFHRRGIGRAMLMHAIAYAERRQLDTVSLYVDAANHPAIALYQGLGFYVGNTHHSLMGWFLLRQMRWLLLRRAVVPVSVNEQVTLRS
ncbi:MAG: GNAT family N-acetyltransferase [Roseiflexaceae bacterium]|jgi:ribosomal protein S18 acetylase RimI-like enzyme